MPAVRWPIGSQPQAGSNGQASQSKDQPAAANEYAVAVEVVLSDDFAEQVSPSDTVYVFARAQGGPPMPLAAKRLTVADLPVRIVMTDADSLLPDLKLSSVDRLELKASVSSEGDAMKAQWTSDSVMVDANDKDAKHMLLINQKN